MKLYIAGKFGARKIINNYIKEAELFGHIITHNWTKFETDNDNSDKKVLASVKDVNGVIDCECLICIMDDPNYAYSGTFTELGVGLALNKKIIIVNFDTKSFCVTNIFYHHPNIIHVDTWNQALELITK